MKKSKRISTLSSSNARNLHPAIYQTTRHVYVIHVDSSITRAIYSRFSRSSGSHGPRSPATTDSPRSTGPTTGTDRDGNVPGNVLLLNPAASPLATSFLARNLFL